MFESALKKSEAPPESTPRGTSDESGVYRSRLYSQYTLMLDQMPISRVMSRPVTVELGTAASAIPLRLRRSRHLFVVDDETVPVGVIQPADLLRHIDGHPRSDLASMSADEIMSRDFLAIGEHEPVGTAAQRFAHSDIDVMAVVSKTMVLVGVLTPEDILRLATSVAANT